MLNKKGNKQMLLQKKHESENTWFVKISANSNYKINYDLS